MTIISKMKMVYVAAILLSLPVVAMGETAQSVAFADVDSSVAMEEVLKIQTLALKRLDFEVFAKEKIQQLNRNHLFSRERMKITRLSDGTYRARYHQIDDSTLKVKVRRSKSSSIPYVGILSYREQVLESSAKTAEQLDENSFAVVEVIPNRHIFSYSKGAWK